MNIYQEYKSLRFIQLIGSLSHLITYLVQGDATSGDDKVLATRRGNQDLNNEYY